MTFKYRYRKQILIVVIIFIILVSSSSFFIFKYKDMKKDKKDTKTIVTVKKKSTSSVSKKTTEKEEKQNDLEIMVDIKGEVINPGIYTLSSNKRVMDAINVAGGLTENADTSVLNLSKKLEDEMVIIVYSHYQVSQFEKTKEDEKIINEGCQNGVNDLKNDACIKDEDKKIQTNKVSINTATIEELVQIDGIGEARAKAIIEYREANGNFEKLEDIKNVSGIGDSLFDKIKESITL